MTTITAAASNATAINRAADAASARYPSEPPPENFSQVLPNASMLSPELLDSTPFAALAPR
ncbi:hypothetical protein [Kitasatospora sp. NPDC048407]|uniref:hypothetical protein n=1 Tax=Kitasatospora sp. NPDC048407 TaxID=3364051 RepID=UPI003711D745